MHLFVCQVYPPRFIDLDSVLELSEEFKLVCDTTTGFSGNLNENPDHDQNSIFDEKNKAGQ